MHLFSTLLHIDLPMIQCSHFSSFITSHNHSLTMVEGKCKLVALLSLSITGKNSKKKEMQA